MLNDGLKASSALRDVCLSSLQFISTLYTQHKINHPDRILLRLTNMSGTTLSVVLAERLVEKIIPSQTFKRKLLPSLNGDDLKPGEILVRTLYLSLEPAMRAWIKGIAFQGTG